MQDPGAPTADTPSAPPAPDQGQASSDPGQGFTSDDATGATQGDASFQTFYDALSDQGTWVQSSDYGYVWQPQVSDPNWAPYTQGHWAYTDDGWTWVSDENFGWATYHYGRWVNLDGYGWVWVPGYTWAPAWVSWRYGDGYAGWAPLPPDSFVGVDYSDGDYSADFDYHIGGDADGYYGIGVGYYIFLPVNYLCYHDYHGHYCDRHDNWHLIGHTANVTNIYVTRHHGAGNIATNSAGFGHRVTVGGPQLSQVNAVSATPIQKVTLTHTTQRGGGTLNGNTLAFYAPHVRVPTTGTALQPPHVSGLIAHASINRGTDILKPLTVNSHLAPPPATQAQVQQAELARTQMPATSKVVVDDAAVRPVLKRPLTSMRPVSTAIRPATAPITPGYAPTRVYPQTGRNTEETPHTYAPAAVYPSNLSETPTVRETAPSRTYAPAPVYPVNPSYQPRSAAGEPSGGGIAPTHTYVQPSPAPAATQSHAAAAPSAPAPSPSSSGGGGHAASSSSSTTGTGGRSH